MKYFIISMPKSGTHLMKNIFLNMNIQHDSDLGFQHYYYKDDKISSNIKENHFTMGHVIYNKKNEKILNNVKKILLIRDLKEIYESNERLKKDQKRNVDFLLIDEKIKKIEDWKNKKDVLTISFNDLILKNIETINSLQIHVLGKILFDSSFLINKSIKDPSPTKSLIRHSNTLDI